MTDDMNQALGLGGKWTIGGREFTFSPLGTAKLSEARAWQLAQNTRALLEALGNVLTVEERWAIISESQYPSRPVDMASLVNDPGLITYLLYLSARKTERGLTFEEFEPYISVENIPDLQHMLDALMLGGPVEDEGDPPVIAAETELTGVPLSPLSVESTTILPVK